MTAPAVDTTAIEHLDFEPACECGPNTHLGAAQCDDPAKWLVTIHGHCVRRQTPWATVLMCDEHFETLRHQFNDASKEWAGAGVPGCVVCRQLFRLWSDLVARVIPL